MKITAKASLIKSNQCEKVRPVALIQEKLARSRLLLQLESCERALLDVTNGLLNPILRQGHHALSGISLIAAPKPVTPDLHDAWFLLTYRRLPLAWWRIDKCTLDQLASGYYGSFSSPLKSPLRAPSHSEFRLVKRMMMSALNTLPTVELDEDALELELVLNSTPIEVPVTWKLDFPKGHFGSSMLFCMTENLLGLMAEQPSLYLASDNLPEKLSHRLKQIPIKALLELGYQSTPITSLNSLKVGDILPMNLHARCPVTVGARPIFYATIHSHEGKMVAKLTQETYQTKEANNV